MFRGRYPKTYLHKETFDTKIPFVSWAFTRTERTCVSVPRRRVAGCHSVTDGVLDDRGIECRHGHPRWVVSRTLFVPEQLIKHHLNLQITPGMYSYRDISLFPARFALSSRDACPWDIHVLLNTALSTMGCVLRRTRKVK